MNQNTYTYTSVRARVFRAIGGGKTLNFSALRSLLSINFFFICYASFLCVSCGKEVFYYPEMQAYYQESCALPQCTLDSVRCFSGKVKSFVSLHPSAEEDPLYPQIQQNIRNASLRLTITINDEWKGDTVIHFRTEGDSIVYY